MVDDLTGHKWLLTFAAIVLYVGFVRKQISGLQSGIYAEKKSYTRVGVIANKSTRVHALQLIQEFYNTTFANRYSLNDTSLVTLTSLTWWTTTSLFIPGGMIGAFLGGWLADKIGRSAVDDIT